jgi:SMC interacting uncharacterized protein involved in chromosome segregation
MQGSRDMDNDSWYEEEKIKELNERVYQLTLELGRTKLKLREAQSQVNILRAESRYARDEHGC